MGGVSKIAKAGISPVLATLILIVIAVVAGILVYAWTVGWLGTHAGAGEVQIRIDDVRVEDGYLHITVRNIGKAKAVVDRVSVEGVSWSVHHTIDVGDVKDIVVAYAWTYKQHYYIEVSTTTGVKAKGTFTVAEYETPYALSFDGTNDYVQVGSSFTKPDKWTLEAWAYFITIPPSGRQGVFGSGWDYNDLYIGLRDGKITAWIYDSSTTSGLYLYSTFTPKTNVWYHIAATYDGSMLKLYVNGELQDDGSHAWTKDTLPMYVGRTYGGEYVNAVIDDVRFYNRPLSADEIKANMRGAITTDGLLLWLRFDEGSGDTVKDVSGYGNNGTIYGATWTSGVTEENVPTAHVRLGIALAPNKEVICP